MLAPVFSEIFRTGPTTLAWKEATWALAELSGKPALLQALERTASDQRLLSRCERNPFLEKFCIEYDEDADIEIRVNYYRHAEYARESLHNHRWSFLSCVLVGSVHHVIFNGQQPDCAQGAFLCSHSQGDAYFVGREFFHYFIPAGGTATLMVRGPRLASSWTQISASQGKARISQELAVEQRKLASEDVRAFCTVLELGLS